MNCLCCGKPITDKATEQEKNTQWHNRCIKKFFGTKAQPDIEVSQEMLEWLAIESSNKGLTVPGVQKKMSLHLDSSGDRPRLTLVNYPTGYILKPNTPDYPCLPEAEYLVMQMAEKAGIKTVPHALIRIKAQDDTFAYITKRIDRRDGKMLAMEDFCQLDGRLTEDKYKGSYERCAKIIQRYSLRTGLDTTELFIRVVFSFIVGNSDMHLKNFSLIETDENSQTYILSDAYDMLPVNIVNPADTEQMALTLNGKKRNLHRNDFLKFADACGMDRIVAGSLIDKLLRNSTLFQNEIEQSYLSDELKDQMQTLITERTEALMKQIHNKEI
ncbi:MAG: HipA domain-containing protein [Ruminococcus sp.]|nr:HipA domain-containing protein [Ruminococcus sp.]